MVTHKHNLLGTSAILLVIKLFAAALGFVFHFLIARKLSINEFGLFNLVLTCLVFSTVLTKQGMESAIVRYFAKSTLERIPSLYLYVLLYSMVNIVIVGGALALFDDFIATSLLKTSQFVAFTPALIGITALQTWLAINSSVLKGRQFPLSSLLFTGVITYSIAIVLFFIVKPVSALQTINILIISTLVATLLSFVFTWYKIYPKNFQLIPFRDAELVPFYRTSRVLFFSSFASVISQQVAVLIIARYTTLADIGLYSIAAKVALLMSYPLLVINAITAPRYARFYSNNLFVKLNRLALHTTKILLVIASIMLLFVLLFANDIVVLFGERYELSAPILIILAIGQWFNLSTGSVVSILVMTGYEKLHRRNSVCIAILTMGSLYVTVPLYGITAAAWITSVAMIAFNLLSLYFVYRYIYSKGIMRDG